MIKLLTRVNFLFIEPRQMINKNLYGHGLINAYAFRRHSTCVSTILSWQWLLREKKWASCLAGNVKMSTFYFFSFEPDSNLRDSRVEFRWELNGRNSVLALQGIWWVPISSSFGKMSHVVSLTSIYKEQYKKNRNRKLLCGSLEYSASK